MLECIRVLINTPQWTPSHSLIFCECHSSINILLLLANAYGAVFNNAEESLQDGSHLFSTQHPIASTVRAAINLEGLFIEYTLPCYRFAFNLSNYYSRWYYRSRPPLPSDFRTDDRSILTCSKAVWHDSCK